jgi:uncharacterized protein YdeI (YjbR/CyaY-like superfamily)
LVDNHGLETAVWIKLAKKDSGATSLSYEEARDIAIAFGWIDGLINRYDHHFYLTRFTPRKTKSLWSKTNCLVAEELISSGAMHPSGLAHVISAKRDGRWDRAYDGASTMTVPDDFQTALTENPAAATAFDQLNAANRYAFLYRIRTASTPQIRLSRIRKYIDMLSAGQKFHPD